MVSQSKNQSLTSLANIMYEAGAIQIPPKVAESSPSQVILREIDAVAKKGYIEVRMLAPHMVAVACVK